MIRTLEYETFIYYRLCMKKPKPSFKNDKMTPNNNDFKKRM